ncbi:ribonuclease 3-like protein 2 [Artemisia annua]|uniref:Ribonuclease 3-like protein 2 n=1 Tax=Artemisia annua TaxID=35608 RepID=A0A2U1MAN5_ARTAN|nr:ribonuclease 3-like protein 2 [Artemisia annua]
MVVHGEQIKAPMAAAVYVDRGPGHNNNSILTFRLSEFLEPINILEKQSQPITMLFYLCHKDGKHIEIKHWWKGEIMSFKTFE